MEDMVPSYLTDKICNSETSDSIQEEELSNVTFAFDDNKQENAHNDSLCN